MKSYRNRIWIGLLAVIVVWCLWYMRPVDIHFLLGNQQAEVFGGTVWPQENFPELTSANFEFDAGTPEMDEFMERFESLRFRRSPLEPLLRILPSGTKATNIDPEKDYRIYLIAFTEDHEILLQIEFNIDQWYYGPSCTLPLSVSGGQETGRELGAYLWQYSQKILSD